MEQIIEELIKYYRNDNAILDNIEKIIPNLKIERKRTGWRYSHNIHGGFCNSRDFDSLEELLSYLIINYEK